MAVIDVKNSSIKIQDGDSPVNSITVKLGEGNLTWSEKYTREYIKDRGQLDTVRNGDEEPMEVSLNATWEFIHSNGSEAITPVEALKKQGAANDWVTTSADACEPYAVDLILENNITCGTTLDERITFPDFRVEQIDFDLRAGTISFSGKCNAVEPVILRTAFA